MNLMLKSNLRCWSLPAIIFVLFSFSQICIAQDSVHVAIGNPDCSPFNVPAHGEARFPIWINLLAPIGGAIINLIKSDVVISEWLGVDFYFSWQHGLNINGNTLRLWFGPTSNYPDTTLHIADIRFNMNADPSYYGQIVQAINAGIISFVDTSGYTLIDYNICISPLCIECASSAGEKPTLPGPINLIVYPNPFNSSTIISFFLATESDVNLSIYDITGRKVKSFEPSMLSAGERAISWNGTDNGGQSLSSGVYFCRLEYGGQTVVSRLTLIK
jgi:hypothetical protein